MALPTQTQVTNYLSDVQNNRQTAEGTFDADSAEVVARPDGTTYFEIGFVPADDDGSGTVDPSEMRTAEEQAVATAEAFRGWDGFAPEEVMIHSNGSNIRVLATHRP